MHSAAYAQPSVDARQDWHLRAQPMLGGGHLLAVIQRALSTCDQDDQLIQVALPTVRDRLEAHSSQVNS